MAVISFFQRYTQRENHATNNTLLALRYFYETAPLKLERALNSLLDEELSIGLTFSQQIVGEASILDGFIQQSALRIFIEAKVAGKLDLPQIKRHIKTIKASGASHGTTILLGITPTKATANDLAEVEQVARSAKIAFKAITYQDLLEALNECCSDFDTQLKAMLGDFMQYLSSEKLLQDRDKWLAVFPCGISYVENERFGAYYEPASRPTKSGCKFLGIYRQKEVSLLGEIKSVLTVGNNTKGESELGNYGEDIARVQQIIAATPYYNLRADEPHRYYLMDKIYRTSFKKTSKNGMMNYRRFDLSLLLGADFRVSAEELAKRLDGRTWA
jgi:hypothetical protein